jgi:hypothetical protein
VKLIKEHFYTGNFKLKAFILFKFKIFFNFTCLLFSSHDYIRWKLLNPPSEEHFYKLKSCKGRLTGDPSHEFECKTFKIVGEGEEETIEEDIVRNFKKLD